jgi:tetratricopeptide (TPR) repeat protein
VYGEGNFSENPVGWENLFQLSVNCSVFEDTRIFQPSTLDIGIWEAAYALSLFGQYFPAYMFADFLAEEGKGHEAAEYILNILVEHNFFRSKDDAKCDFHGYRNAAGHLLGAEKVASIRSSMARMLLSHCAKGRLRPCFGLLSVLHNLGGKITPALAIEAVKNDVMNGTCRDIEKALAENHLAEICGTEYSFLFSYIFRTLKTFVAGNEAEILASVEDAPETEEPNFKTEILILNALYKIGIRDTEKAFSEIKKSMPICQNSNDKHGITRTHRLFALVNLLRNEFNAASDYLSFAVKEAGRNENSAELSLACYYTAVCDFLFGNISKALQFAKQSEHNAVISGRDEWTVRAKFFTGRCYFEAGLYEEALDLFKDLQSNCSGSSSENTISAWIFRTETYLYGKSETQCDFSFGDGRFFEIEAAYFDGNYEKAVKLSDRLLLSLPEESFLFIEQPDWSSGFAQCELLRLPRKDFWFELVTVLRALSLAMLKPKDTDALVTAIKNIIRDEKHSDTNPHLPFYFFANYKVLRETGATDMDKNNVIRMAFSRLRHRVNRIEDNETRRDFLSKPYWNNAITQAAKEHGLT